MRTGGHALPPPSLCSEISCPVAMEEDQEEVRGLLVKGFRVFRV